MRIVLSLSIFLMACPSTGDDTDAIIGPGICLCYADTYAETGGLIGDYICNAVGEGEKSEECENDYPACTWHPEMTCDEAKAERESGIF